MTQPKGKVQRVMGLAVKYYKYRFMVMPTGGFYPVFGIVKARDEADARRKLINKFDYPMEIVSLNFEQVVTYGQNRYVNRVTEI